MIKKIPAENRYHASHGWLSTYHLFSFADYYDEGNMNFGTLRVFNDDTIDAQSGFGAHSHENMEIVTIVLEGELTHKDSMGNVGTIAAGEIQYMSAGTGVTHAEMNTTDSPVHLYQIWLVPKEKGLAPAYAQKDFNDISNRNVLLPVVAATAMGEALQVRTNAVIYTSSLESGEMVNHTVENKRGAFIYVERGSLDVNQIEVSEGDQLRIDGEENLAIFATEDARLVLINVPLSY